MTNIAELNSQLESVCAKYVHKVKNSPYRHPCCHIFIHQWCRRHCDRHSDSFDTHCNTTSMKSLTCIQCKCNAMQSILCSDSDDAY